MTVSIAPSAGLLRGLALAVLLTTALSACKQAPPAGEPVRAVKVMTVGVDSYDTAIEFSGEVRARIETRLGFRVAGKITKRQAEVGQHVKPGDVLAQLDPRTTAQLAADAARAQSAAALTNRDLAAADLKRYRGLRDQNFISGADLEWRAEATFKVRARPN